VATIPLILEKVNLDRRMAKWLNMQNGDVGEPADFALLPDNTATVIGNPWGVGGELRMKGSNDGVNWFQLTKTDHVNPCMWAMNGMVLMLERPRFIRPEVTGGDGTTLLDVHIMFR